MLNTIPFKFLSFISVTLRLAALKGVPKGGIRLNLVANRQLRTYSVALAPRKMGTFEFREPILRSLTARMRQAY